MNMNVEALISEARTDTSGQWIHVRDAEALVIATVKECIAVAGPDDSYRDQWFDAKADSVSCIKHLFGIE